ncbi:MAG TPA: secretin N-terminal domain-containing protein [Sedimentisphaerales bacterium]|nr:secretin N-terminal domain-containing protein [Sedimentisphaerales bacterium]HNU29479.1 secretin N-terminal domain-containing protein [Sedimentisphaerales bacterium]
MERSKIVLWVLVLVAAGVIIWWVGFRPPASDLPRVERKGAALAGARMSAPNEPNSPESDAAPADANQPGGKDPNQSGDKDPNQPKVQAGAPEPNTPAKPDEAKPSDAKPAKAEVPEDPNDPLEAVNLKDVEMKNIIEKIAQWTGKAVIPSDDAMKQKITIYAPDKLPRSKALLKIYSALRMKGFTPEIVDDTIFLKPLSEARLGVHPIVPPDQPLAAFENPAQIVQKLFKLANYPPAQMAEIVRPLIGEYGHVGADETTGTLLVIDTVGNLMRIENIIAQFDVPGAGKIATEIFEIDSGDPTEMVQVLRLLLGGTADGRRGGQLRSSGTSSRPASQSSGGGGKGATSVVIGVGDIPIVLIPEPKRKWIIARASPETIKQIGEWIAKMDREQPIAPEYETVSIIYANVDEVARRIQQSLEDMPGTELRPNVLVQPLSQTRQIMIFGRADLRQMIKKLIAEVDVMPGQFLTEVFDLKHADPDQIKTNIEGLYESQSGTSYSYGYRSSRYRDIQPSETVKAISYPSMGQITVIASAENMEKIRKQIADWDVPLDVEQVKPRIVELKNSDPVQMARLLTKLFSEDSEGSNSLFRILYYGFDEMQQKKKIIGPLYGQLTFEEVPGTKKIIVISKIPQAYEVIEQLIMELDRQEMAEIPHVVQIKYADTEDLTERLNAMFNEQGTPAPIRRTTRGIGDYSMDSGNEGQNQNSSRNSNPSNSNRQNNADTYTPPWSSGGARRMTNEQPISNVIGRVRFIPDPRSKSILVLAPPEFQKSIEETIRQLDVPGKQVMIKAVVVEVDHQDMTSLGVQLSSNPGGTFSVGENGMTALGELTYLQERGSATIEVGTSVTGLLDLLVKKVNAKILNQQSLWTEDNEEASFFKGQRIAFQTSSTTSETGISRTQNYDYQDVGMTLAVRPSITPEKNVDMMVTVLLSDLTGDSTNGQPNRRVMNSTTNMIVQNGQTLMLGGILFQTDSKIERKVPLLGDVPLLGELFKHHDVKKANNELIVFITPYVIDEETSETTKAEIIEQPKQKLEMVEGELKQMSEDLEKALDKN